MAKYLSGRVKRVPQSQLTDDRYQSLALNQTEPNLGDPSLFTQNLPIGVQQQVVSVIGYPGQRYWIPVSGSSPIGGISVYDENIIVPTNAGVGSITQINFVGAAISAKGYLNLDGSPGIGVTITVFSPGSQGQVIFNNNNDFKGASSLFYDNSTNYVGIGTTIPTQELDINGDLRLRGTIYDYNNQPGNNNELLVKNNFGGLTWVNQSTIRAGAGGTVTNIQYHNDAGLVDGASDFVFNYTNNRVGIGTTTPSVKLDVIGNTKVKGDFTVTNGELYITRTDTGTGDILANGGTDGIFGIANTTNSGSIYLSAKNSSGTLNNTITLNSSSATINGALTVAGDTQFDGNVRVGISTTSNYIAFRGTIGDGVNNSGEDQDGTWKKYTHTYIGERIYDYSGNGEKSELLLFKGNDEVSGVGPDRIRLAAGEFRFDTILVGLATAGTFEEVGVSTFITNKMILTGAGNLGIGTTNPTSKLHVSGDSLITGVSTFGSNVLPSGANQNIGSGSQKWEKIYANNFEGTFIGNADTASKVATISTATDGTYHPTFVNSNNSPAEYESLYTNSGLSYTLSTGNLGIGTTNPLTKLDVRGVITAGSNNSTQGTEILRGYYGNDGALSVIGSEYSSGGLVLGYAVKPSTTTPGQFYSSTTVPIDRSAYVVASSGGIAPHRWYIGANQTVAENSSVTMSEVMRLNSFGNLGIGTTNPTEKLSVYGAIESLTDSIGEGGQFILRGKTGTPIRWNIDNYSLGVTPNLFRIVKEDNSAAGANGRVYVGITTIGEFIIGDGAGALSPTGTANQQLQVQSGAYIQNSLGIGITNPTSSLSVNGSTVIGTETLNMTGLSSTFTTVGSNTFTVPTGVTKISAVLIAGGGAGGGSNGGAGGNGGGGGGLVYINDYAVSPGQNLTVVVGGGGAGGIGGAGGDGGDSSITGVATAFGGKGGAATAGDNGSLGGSGGSNFANSGISNGGPSGKGTNTTGGGGGGSAGYSGNGGSGGGNNISGTEGSGGSGGGGSQGNTDIAGNGGGGTGILGQGSSGVFQSNVGGGGGSGGANGVTASSTTGSSGGNYGGGGGGADGDTGASQSGGNGGQGVVRIIWSPSSKFSRLFPTNQVGNNINQ